MDNYHDMNEIYPHPPEHFKEFANELMEPPRLPENREQCYYSFGEKQKLYQDYYEFME